MNDSADQAALREAINLAEALETQRIVAENTHRPAPVGYCLNPLCCEDFEPDSIKLFCGPKCAEQHHIYTNR